MAKGAISHFRYVAPVAVVLAVLLAGVRRRRCRETSSNTKRLRLRAFVPAGGARIAGYVRSFTAAGHERSVVRC